MPSLLKKRRGSDGGRSGAGARRHTSPRVRPALEGLEARELKTGQITFNVDTISIDGLSVGTQADVKYDGGAWWNPFDDLIRVSLTDRQTNQLLDQAAIPAGVVKHVVFFGGGGDDVFNDPASVQATAYGDAGNDTLNGGNANDTLFGGDGYDTLYGNGGNDYLNGGNQDDYLNGGDGNDTLAGESGNDQMRGGDGDDTLHGGDGFDSLSGDFGSDVLYGDAGNDYLNGGWDGSNDLLYGGTGADTFVQYYNPTWWGGYVAEDTLADKNDSEGDVTR
jgi:Ca2+-binding RTX toxin-like protein